MPTKLPNKKKIFNDPVYGFVSIPNELIFDVVEHQYFQRLRRIKQLGLTHLVFPGALHTRFQHSLGAMHLMQQVVSALKAKGNEITDDESQAVQLAILLHDLGHGPYSHTLERTIVQHISHEQLSILFMRRLNEQFAGALGMATAIFNGTYPKKFLHELVSSQLDMDRIDYLKRDSFFTGVLEGAISADRLITMMDVVDDKLVVEAKGIYSLEKFLIARRLMYWQVYLHKTVLSAEYMLMNALGRARQLAREGRAVVASKPFAYFLTHDPKIDDFEHTNEPLENFALLDDFDIMWALKQWMTHDDKTLAYLSSCIVNRHLFKAEIQNDEFDEAYIATIKSQIADSFKGNQAAVDYLFIEGSTSNHAYNPGQAHINILSKEGQVTDIRKASIY
jgi:uncharacterized protein